MISSQEVDFLKNSTFASIRFQLIFGMQRPTEGGQAMSQRWDTVASPAEARRRLTCGVRGWRELAGPDEGGEGFEGWLGARGHNGKVEATPRTGWDDEATS